MSVDGWQFCKAFFIVLAVTDVVEITATEIIRRLGGIFIENILNSFDVFMSYHKYIIHDFQAQNGLHFQCS